MAENLRRKKKRSRRKWWPLGVAGLLVAHGALFLWLGQCSGPAGGYQSDVSYIRVNQSQIEHNLTLEFHQPPERLFPQYISMAQEDGVQSPLLLVDEEEQEKLDDLNTFYLASKSGMEVRASEDEQHFRLTLEKGEAPIRGRAPVLFVPSFPVVQIAGQAWVPSVSVPEPSVFLLSIFSVPAFLQRRRCLAG